MVCTGRNVYYIQLQIFVKKSQKESRDDWRVLLGHELLDDEQFYFVLYSGGENEHLLSPCCIGTGQGN